MQELFDDAVGSLIGVGQVTRNQRLRDPIVAEAKRNNVFVRVLWLKNTPINRATVKPRCGSSL